MDRLKVMLESGRGVVAAWCGIADPRYLETVAEHDFDVLVLDMQHGFFDEYSIQQAIASVIARGRAPLVRVPLARWDTAARVLDFGALGVIAPMINNADDARALVSATRMVPTGERSFGPRHAAGLYGVAQDHYLREFDKCSKVLAMIETREAVGHLDEIVAVDGIDGLLIGPGDLSISLRQDPVPDAYGPDSIEIVGDIIAAAHAAGKIIAAFTIDAPTANRLRAMGADIVSVGLDGTYLADGIHSHLAALDFRDGPTG